jgi:hypothetical protein
MCSNQMTIPPPPPPRRLAGCREKHVRGRREARLSAGERRGHVGSDLWMRSAQGPAGKDLLPTTCGAWRICESRWDGGDVRRFVEVHAIGVRARGALEQFRSAGVPESCV